MKYLKNISLLFILLVAFAACNKEYDNLKSVDSVTAPSNVQVQFNIAQDNSGMVTIIPSADGVVKYKVLFGDTADETASEYGVYDKITHTYSEGTFHVVVTAVGLTGLSTSAETDLSVTFKAPENLVVTIDQDAANPHVVSVSAKADYATVMDIYFGDQENEEPVHALPEEVVEHTYADPGDYIIRVVAKSGGAATTEERDTITVTAASDPVNLPIDFESFTVNYAFENFGNAFSEVVDNPDASGINTSAKVAQMTKNDGAEVWAGSFLTMENPIDFSTNKLFKVKVLSPKAGAIVKLKVENLNDSNIWFEVDATTTVENQWEELSYDFSAIDMANEYQKVVIFFDFGNPGDGSVYYYDDIKLTPASIPTTSMIQDFEGTPPAFTAFGNIADIEVLANPDPAGANTTATVAKLTKTAGAEIWAGCFFETDTPLDFENYSKINVKVWSPKSGIVVKLKLENQDASITHEVDVTNTTANEWENLLYDFSDAPAADYVRVVIFFDFGNNGDDTEYYFDEIELTN